MLFISASEHAQVTSILDALEDWSVLTVSEADQFTQFGGIIRMIVRHNKVRFEINVDAAERANLKVSSKLLNLAKVVKTDGKK